MSEDVSDSEGSDSTEKGDLNIPDSSWKDEYGRIEAVKVSWW